MAGNGLKWLEMAKDSSDFVAMAGTGWNWLKIYVNGR